MAKLTEDLLVKRCDDLFQKQYPMLSLYQTIADHFYPERADFVITRNTGNEVADGILNSYPVLVRRDLCNSFSSMLRDGEWFNMSVKGDTDYDGSGWLQWASGRLKDLMDDRSSGFVRATKEGDHDYGSFGQCVISVELNKKANGLLYRCWHLRDCAWFEDETGQVGGVFRKWKPTYTQLFEYFDKEKLHQCMCEKLQQTPFGEAEIIHAVIPSSMYGDEEIKNPYVSIYLDVANKHIIEAVGINHKHYVVPRFQTVSGSQYAYSPATIIALPDARTLQAMTFTLLEAGERYARPPIIATQKAIRSDIDLSPDGVTYVDDEYDERFGAALRTLPQDRGGFPIGLEMRDNIIGVLESAFYLNKINLPSVGREMTAYEVQERMKQFRRENLPLFAPIESEYNGQLCEISFEIAMSAGLLGSPYDIPQSLQDRDVVFKFKSPLSQTDEETKVNRFAQYSRMISEAASLDPASMDNADFDTALRDAITGSGAPSTWLKSVDQVAEERQMKTLQQAAAVMAQQEQGLEQ